MLTITEEEARGKNLLGCDVFKRTHLAYKNDFYRDDFAVSLYQEAYKIFLSSELIAKFPILKAESLKDKAALKNGTYQISQTQWKRLKYINLENFLIATGFELFIKSQLLEMNFLVNELENKNEFKELWVEQMKRPVHKNELFKISGYFYNPTIKMNFLKGITEKSIKFSLILKNARYCETLNLSPELLAIIEDYRKLRNQIHLPGDFEYSPNLTRLGENLVPTIATFIDTMIVEKTNQLVDKLQLSKVLKLSKLNY